MVRQITATPLGLIGLRLYWDLDGVSWNMSAQSHRHVLILDDRSAILVEDMFLTKLAEGWRVRPVGHHQGCCLVQGSMQRRWTTHLFIIVTFEQVSIGRLWRVIMAEDN